MIVYDSESSEVLILEKVKRVSVFLGGEMRLGDFKGENPDELPF